MENRIFTKYDCCRTMYDLSVETNQGCIAIIKPELLNEVDRTGCYQLVRLVAGFGCKPSTSGNACYVSFCVNGYKKRIERYDIIGIANEEITRYAMELESNISFTEEEKIMLLKSIRKDSQMFQSINDVKILRSDFTKKVSNIYVSLNKKLSSEMPQHYEDEELYWLNVSFVMYGTRVVDYVRKKGYCAEKNLKCQFLDKLAIKLNRCLGGSI